MRSMWDSKIGAFIILGVAFSIILISSLSAQQELNIAPLDEIRFSETTKTATMNLDDLQAPKTKHEVFPQKITFYNNDGTAEFTKEYTENIGVVSTANNKFLQIWRHSIPPSKDATGINTVDVLDNKGSVLWSKDFPSYPYGLSPYLILSNQGTGVGVMVDQNKLIFFDDKGNKQNEILVLSPEEAFDKSRENFSSDGSLFTIAFAYRCNPVSPDSKRGTRGRIDRTNTMRDMNSELITFTEDGNEVWRSKLQAKRISRMFISPDDKYLVCTYTGPGARDKTTFFIDIQTGEELFFSEGIDAHYAEFFNKDNQDFVVLSHQANKLILVNLNTRKVSPLYTTTGGNKILGLVLDQRSHRIGHIAAEQGYEPALRGQRVTLSSYFLRLFNFDGSLISQGSIPIENMGFIRGGDEIKLAKDRLAIHLHDSKRVLLFSISK